MTPGFAEYLASWQSTALAGFIVFLRIGAVMAMLPVFGEMAVPVRVRLAAAAAFTAVVAPAVYAQVVPAAGSGLALAIALASETLIGLSIGFAVRLLVWALQIAGVMIAQATALSQLFGFSSGEPSPAVSQALWIGGLALAASAGLHVHIARMLIESYAVLPAGVLQDAASLLGWAVGHVASAFALAFQLAVPALIASLLVNLAMGAMNRAMPALMITFIGVPAQTLAALGLIAVITPVLLAIWLAVFTSFLADPFGGVR